MLCRGDVMVLFKIKFGKIFPITKAIHISNVVDLAKVNL